MSISCPLCSNSETKYIVRIHSGDIMQCAQCNIFFHHPAMHALLDTGNSSAPTDFREDSQLNKARERIYRAVFPLLKQQASPETAALLDMGCGDGYFLFLLKQQGWENLTGIDIAPQAKALAHKKFTIEVKPGDLREQMFADNSFHIITLWDVLDQLINPVEVMCEIHRILKPGGLLIMRMRNMSYHIPMTRYFSWLTRSWRVETSIMHQYGFSPGSIYWMLHKINFAKINAQNSVLSHGDPYTGKSAVKNIGITFGKIFLYSLTQVIACFSFGKLLYSPSIMIYAKKHE